MSGAPPIRSMRTSTPTLARRFTDAVYHTPVSQAVQGFVNFNTGNGRGALIATIDNSPAQVCNQTVQNLHPRRALG